jgi:hypothetical protein
MEQDAVGGARLTIEIGADFAIGPTSSQIPRPSVVSKRHWAND